MNSNMQLKQKIYDSAIMGLLNERTDNLAEDYFKLIVEEQKKYNYKKQDVSPLNKKDFPFEIPSNWIWQKIGNLEEINLGFTYKPEYSDDGVIFLSVKDISSGTINFNNVQHVSKEVYNNAAYGCKPKKGDILFGRIGTIGVPYILDVDDEICIFVSLGFFRDYTELINKKYICYWMNSTLFKNQVRENVKGAAQINLNTNWLKEFYIPLPPKEEQDKIVEKVEITFELLETKEKNDREILKLKETLKEKILDSAIHGTLVENDISLPSVSFESIEDNPFELPSNWIWSNFDKMAIKISDGTHSTPKYTDKGVPFLSVKDMSDGKLHFDNCKYISKEEHDILYKRCDPKKNDLLITKVGTTGIPVIVDTDDEFSIFVSVAQLRFELEKLDLKFIRYVVLSKFVQDIISENTRGAANKNWVIKDIKKTTIPLPPLEEQHRIVEKIEKCFELIEQL